MGGFHDGDDGVEDVGLVRLHDVPTHHHLVDYKVGLLYVKHYLRGRAVS